MREWTLPAPLDRIVLDKGWMLEIAYLIPGGGWEITVLYEHENNRARISLPAVLIKPDDMPSYIHACALAYGEAKSLGKV